MIVQLYVYSRLTIVTEGRLVLTAVDILCSRNLQEVTGKAPPPWAASYHSYSL
jgi:hypothetical protein